MSEDGMKEIMQRIRDRRLLLGYSYQELAQRTGMSKSTLQRYEAGAIKNLPLDRLADLARALDTSPEWILGRKEAAPSDAALSQDERKVLVLARHLEKIPPEKRARIIQNFEDTIDTYLDAMGLTSTEENLPPEKKLPRK